MRVNQARVKNADLRHLSCTVVMYRRKSASPVCRVSSFRVLNNEKYRTVLHSPSSGAGFAK